jgi:hypothetical protein
VRRWGLLLAALVAGVAEEAQAQARPGTIDITIMARTPNAVHVEERYALGPSDASIELRVLTRPCVLVENMRIERDGVVLPGAEARHGPWITWRDSTPPGDSLRLLVRYDLWLGGSRTIPLVHLAAPLARNDSSRQGAVTVTVRFARSAGRVEFPHMSRSVPTLSTERAEPAEPVGAPGASSRNGTRQAPNEWSGRYVATPSFVKVGGPGLPCDERVDASGDNGGLVWRFFLLVGIMVAWVPIYLSWARRSGESA